MNHKSEVVVNRDRIACLAFQLREKAGCPEGRDLEFWLAAETRLLSPQQTEAVNFAPSLGAWTDLANLIEQACALCCERRAGIIFRSLPWKVRQACIKDSGIGNLVARAEPLGQKPSDAVLAPEMVRVFRRLQ